MAEQPALALAEFSSVARGIEAADAMVKKAPITTIKSGTVQPGRYLVLIAGDEASVDESLAAGIEAGGEALLDTVFLPQVHTSVVDAIAGGRELPEVDALGVIETTSVPSTLQAADAGVKGADVVLLEVRMADGLGGKGICFFSGAVADVEAAFALGVGSLPHLDLLLRQVVIPALHEDMAENIWADTRFAPRVRGTTDKPSASG
ncbi:MAG: BMC domain-containing protein [Anaerolineae bacterium]